MSQETILRAVLDLDVSDMEIVIAALENYKSKEAFGDLLEMTMTPLMAPSNPLEREMFMNKRKKDIEEKHAQREDDLNRHKELCDLVRSKLIIIRETKRRLDFVETSKKIEA